ncbi:MAG: carbamoyl phosphate synthase small subunit [Ruminococcaceae bacterium]|nr:carbamoyl phosphate synthase small subunit [Oscillospiraceae bacterium]
MKKVYLVTEDGHSFEGYSFGADKEVCGELVFNTAMVGYIEALTDPAYYGQILVQTFPMVGNYGIISEDFENNCSVKALIVREWCDTPSNFRCEYDLDKFLKDNDVAGIYGIDTREITKYLRENGTMNAKICYSVPENLDDIKNFKIVDAVSKVTCDKVSVYAADGDAKYNVTVVDYGVKKSFIAELCKRGCNVKVVPANTKAEEILADKPDGVMLSGGPGDPSEYFDYLAEVAKLMGKVPMFGIGLGHQMMALVNGGKIEKLKYGHRGGNQPSHKVGTNRTYITSQNNGYTVVADKLTRGVVSFINANDDTCEGIEYPDFKAFSVQFYPESIAGLHSTSFLYDRFIELMGGN